MALVGQLVVELETTLGRSVSLDFHVLEVQAFTVLVDFLEQLDKLAYRVVLELALAQIGLVDEELDVGFLLLGLNALERVESQTATAIGEGLTIEL